MSLKRKMAATARAAFSREIVERTRALFFVAPKKVAFRKQSPSAPWREPRQHTSSRSPSSLMTFRPSKWWLIALAAVLIAPCAQAQSGYCDDAGAGKSPSFIFLLFFSFLSLLTIAPPTDDRLRKRWLPEPGRSDIAGKRGNSVFPPLAEPADNHFPTIPFHCSSYCAKTTSALMAALLNVALSNHACILSKAGAVRHARWNLGCTSSAYDDVLKNVPREPPKKDPH